VSIGALLRKRPFQKASNHRRKFAQQAVAQFRFSQQNASFSNCATGCGVIAFSEKATFKNPVFIEEKSRHNLWRNFVMAVSFLSVQHDP
jgi:hypothetical protein